MDPPQELVIVTLLERSAPLPTMRVRLEGEELMVQVGEQGGMHGEVAGSPQMLRQVPLWLQVCPGPQTLVEYQVQLEPLHDPESKIPPQEIFFSELHLFSTQSIEQR